jgi:hypothetical protein
LKKEVEKTYLKRSLKRDLFLLGEKMKTKDDSPRDDKGKEERKRSFDPTLRG